MSTNLAKTNEIVGKFADKLCIVDHKAVTDFWDISIQEDIQVRYSEESLYDAIQSNQKGEGWILVYHSGLSLNEMLENIRSRLSPEEREKNLRTIGSTQKFLYDHPLFSWGDCYYGHSINITLNPTYYLLNFNGKFGGSTWNDQQTKLSAIKEMGLRYDRAHQNVVADAVICDFSQNGNWLMKEWIHCGLQSGFPGHHITVGESGSSGLHIKTCRDNLPKGHIVLSREFDF